MDLDTLPRKNMRTPSRLLAVAAAALVAGCSTTNAIQKGNARLIPESVTFDYTRIAGVLDVNGRRQSVSILRYQCMSGVGTLVIEDRTTIDNVLISGDKPEDRLFKELCAAGAQLIQRQGVDR